MLLRIFTGFECYLLIIYYMRLILYVVYKYVNRRMEEECTVRYRVYA